MPNATAMGSLMVDTLMSLGATILPTKAVWLFIAAPVLELPAAMGRALQLDGNFITTNSNITIQGGVGGTFHLPTCPLPDLPSIFSKGDSIRLMKLK